MRNALAHVGKGQHTVVAATIRQAFIQPDRQAAGQVWRNVADQLRPRFEKLAKLACGGLAMLCDWIGSMSGLPIPARATASRIIGTICKLRNERTRRSKAPA